MTFMAKFTRLAVPVAVAAIALAVVSALGLMFAGTGGGVASRLGRRGYLRPHPGGTGRYTGAPPGRDSVLLM